MYKVTLYQRANYPNGGQVLLDTSSGINPGVVAAVCEPKLNEAGSFTFTIAKGHPLYDSIAALETYVSVEEDSEEIFYGRIIMIQKNRIGGTKQVTCEGAFAFLLDYEMNADVEETTYTAAAYFQRCIDAYNAGIGTDPARHIGVGTINISGASESKSYKNGSVSQAQSVLRSKLMNAYDGFVRIRRNGTDHLIDWLSQVGTDNPQTIAIAQNVISQATNESGEDIFTLIWPQGNNKIRIDPIPLSQDMLNRYGRIIRTVNFDANNEADLRTKALAYIAKLRDRLSLTGDIGFVDMQYLDGTSPRVVTGDVFTHITGYEGTRFTAESVKRDLLNPANDKVSLKTDKDLMNTANSNGANSGSSAVGGAGGGAGRSLSGGGSKWYKFIHETDEDLLLAAKNIEISAQEKIAINARDIATNAETISNVSAVANGAAGKWTSFEGTGIYQNREAIDAVAGKFKIDNQGKLVLKEGTQFRISANGTSTNVGQLIFEQDNRVGDVGQLLLGYQGSYTYQHDNEIGGLVGAYETNTYQDPENPFKEITPSAGANPKELGYYEKNGDNYVKTNDETAIAGKKYYVPNDITEVIFKGGGGYKIRKNGVEYGVYDGENLTGGVIVKKLNDNTTTTKIKGTRVIIGENLTDDDLSTWAADADAGTGVFAKFLTVRKLTAQEIQTVLANIGTANIGNILGTNLELDDEGLGGHISCGPIDCGQVNATGVVIDSGNIDVGGEVDAEALKIMSNAVNVLDASVSGNTLTITKYNYTNEEVETITFSKATTLEAGVSSGNGKFTITAYQTNNGRKTEVAHHDVRLGGSYGSSWTTLDITTGGNPTIVENSGTKYLSVPVKLQQLTGAYSQPADVGTDEIYYGLSLVMEKKTGTNRIISNGTYAPSGNFIGFSEVEIDVQSGMTATGLEIDYQNHQIKVSSTSTLQNATITCAVGIPTYNQSNHTYSCAGMALANGTSVATATSPVSGTQAFDDGHDDGGATANVSRAAITEQDIPAGSIPVTLDYDAYYSITPTYTNSSGNVVPITANAQYIKTRPDRYNAGQNSVTISKGNWSNGQIQFTKSAGTASTQSVNLDADDPSWSGNVATVAIYDGDPGGTGVSTGYSVTVNATGRYNDGWDYGIENKIANATPASKILSFGESVTANVVGVKSDGTLSQLCWATFTAPSPSTPVISLPGALPNSPTSSAESLRYNSIPISASADGLSASENLSLGAGLFYNGTTQNYCMNLYSSANQSGNVIGRISIQQLLDNQWVAGAQSVINAGGPYSAGPGEYTLNQYVTTLTVTGSSGGDIDISNQNWYNSGDILPAADATLNTSGGYITKNKRGYLYFKVTSTGEATKVYRIPIDTT